MPAVRWREALVAIAALFLVSRGALVLIAWFLENNIPLAYHGPTYASGPLLSSFTGSDSVYLLGIAAEGYHGEPVHDGVPRLGVLPALPAAHARSSPSSRSGTSRWRGSWSSNVAFVGALAVLYALDGPPSRARPGGAEPRLRHVRAGRRRVRDGLHGQPLPAPRRRRVPRRRAAALVAHGAPVRPGVADAAAGRAARDPAGDPDRGVERRLAHRCRPGGRHGCCGSPPARSGSGCSPPTSAGRSATRSACSPRSRRGANIGRPETGNTTPVLDRFDPIVLLLVGVLVLYLFLFVFRRRDRTAGVVHALALVTLLTRPGVRPAAVDRPLPRRRLAVLVGARRTGARPGSSSWACGVRRAVRRSTPCCTSRRRSPREQAPRLGGDRVLVDVPHRSSVAAGSASTSGAPPDRDPRRGCAARDWAVLRGTQPGGHEACCCRRSRPASAASRSRPLLAHIPRVSLEYLGYAIVLAALYLLLVRSCAHEFFGGACRRSPRCSSW